MLGLYYNAVLICVISTAICGPMPQHLFEDGPFQNQQKHAIDFFSTRLVGNPKVRRNYLNCFLDNGPCSPEAKNIKRMVPDAIKNECEHCTELQKKVIEKMMCYLNNHQPDILKQVAAKFDPNGEYMKQYINKIENDQFLNPQLQNTPKNQFQPQPQQPQEKDQNQQRPHLNQPDQGQNQPDQDQNKNHHSQPDNQQPHQNHQQPQNPQNPQQQQPQNPHQQQPQNPHQQQPQNPHQQQPQNPHHHQHPHQPPQNQQPQNPHQQQPQNPHQQQPQNPHHHHHPQQPPQNQQPQQH